jgi:hypothetical protein
MSLEGRKSNVYSVTKRTILHQNRMIKKETQLRNIYVLDKI